MYLWGLLCSGLVVIPNIILGLVSGIIIEDRDLAENRQNVPQSFRYVS